MSGINKGNQFWKLRTKHGRTALFADADLLLAEAYAYFELCQRFPWEKPELVKHKGEAVQYDIPLGHMFSMDGLTVYLGVSGSYFRTRKIELGEKRDACDISAKDEALLEAIERIEAIIRTQQIGGAAVRVFEGGLVSRLNNLADNVNQNNTGETGLRVSVIDQETADNLKKLDAYL